MSHINVMLLRAMAHLEYSMGISGSRSCYMALNKSLPHWTPVVTTLKEEVR